MLSRTFSGSGRGRKIPESAAVAITLPNLKLGGAATSPPTSFLSFEPAAVVASKSCCFKMLIAPTQPKKRIALASECASNYFQDVNSSIQYEIEGGILWSAH